MLYAMTNTTIVIPTYNEKDNIEILVKAIFELLPHVHILVVDGNSPDGTSEIVKKLQNQYPNLSLIINPKKEGLGQAYIAGFKKVINDNITEAILMMDGDLSHQPKYIFMMLEEMEKNNRGLVIGSRYVPGGGVTKKWEVWRRILSRFANFYCRLILGYPIKDWTGGFNLIRTEILKQTNFQELSQFKGYAFIIALKFFLLKAGAGFREMPIFFEERSGGESKLSKFVIKEGIFAPLKLILKFSSKNINENK